MAPHSHKEKESHKHPVKGKRGHDSHAAVKAAAKQKKAAEPRKETAKAAKVAAKGTAIKETSTKATAAKGKEKKSKICTEEGCHQPLMAEQYCRLHYIKYWSNIISNRKAQARANLNKYIENLSEKFPDEYMEKIRDDLGNEGAFHARLRELGFREEYESGGDNPFQMENFDEFVHGLKFED